MYLSSWGAAAICSGVVHNLAGLAACRAILGVCEVMLATGSPFYLSMFYQRHELGLRMAFLLGSSPLANCFASAVAYGITHINSSWADWRWLFVIGKKNSHVRSSVEGAFLTIA